MIPPKCSLHTQKTVICGPSLTTQGQENSPAQPGGANDENVMSTQERQRRSSPLSPISVDYKAVAN